VSQIVLVGTSDRNRAKEFTITFRQEGRKGEIVLSGHARGYLQYEIQTDKAELEYAKYFTVTTLSVDEAYQGWGLGEALLYFADLLAIHRGIKYVAIEGAVSKDKVDWYRHVGFFTRGKRLARHTTDLRKAMSKAGDDEGSIGDAIKTFTAMFPDLKCESGKLNGVLTSKVMDKFEIRKLEIQ
jgi:GNAT superfamily N-acetyltransferase